MAYICVYSDYVTDVPICAGCVSGTAVRGD